MSETTHHTKNATFGSSFFWGVVVGATGLYLLGTKNGRHIVKQMMESVEKLENSAEEIFETLQEQAQEGLDPNSIAEMVSEKAKEEMPNVSSNMHSIMEKIKSSIPTNHRN